MKNIKSFLSENFQFLVVKFSVYLNKLVFVMAQTKRFYIYIYFFIFQYCSLLNGLFPVTLSTRQMYVFLFLIFPRRLALTFLRLPHHTELVLTMFWKMLTDKQKLAQLIG